MTLKQKLAAVEAERDAALLELGRLKDPDLRHFRFENGEFNMELAGPVVQHLVRLFAEYFRALGAKNYIEFGLHSAAGENYLLTVQNARGMSPAMMVGILRDALGMSQAAEPGWEAVGAAAMTATATAGLIRDPGSASNTDAYPNKSVSVDEPETVRR